MFFFNTGLEQKPLSPRKELEIFAQDLVLVSEEKITHAYVDRCKSTSQKGLLYLRLSNVAQQAQQLHLSRLSNLFTLKGSSVLRAVKGRRLRIACAMHASDARTGLGLGTLK